MVKVFAQSVRPDSVGVEFDDERLVANAGLILVGTLSKRLGIERMSEFPWNFDGDPHGLTITP